MGARTGALTSHGFGLLGIRIPRLGPGQVAHSDTDPAGGGGKVKKLIYGAVPARSSGFDDRRNPRRDSEPSAKAPRDSNKARNPEIIFLEE